MTPRAMQLFLDHRGGRRRQHDSHICCGNQRLLPSVEIPCNAPTHPEPDCFASNLDLGSSKLNPWDFGFVHVCLQVYMRGLKPWALTRVPSSLGLGMSNFTCCVHGYISLCVCARAVASEFRSMHVLLCSQDSQVEYCGVVSRILLKRNC